MIPTHGYDFVQWTADRRCLYESNYLKANSPDGRRGFWIKHNILAPEEEGRPAVLECWCVLFDRDQGPPRALKEVHRMTEIIVSKSGLAIEGDGVLLTDRGTKTTMVDSSGSRASWDLAFTPLELPLFHMPYNKMYTAPLPKKKMITPAPKLRFQGVIDFDGTVVEIKDWIGLRGHNWGSEHANAYAYGNCNLFERDETALVDMFSAKIMLGPVRTPWLSMGVLRMGGREHGFRSLRHFVTRKAEIDFPRWNVVLRAGRKTLESQWSLKPEECIGLRYLHPDGKVSYCYNTKFADLTIKFGNRTLTSDQAELEFLFDQPIEGIPLFGDEHLP